MTLTVTGNCDTADVHAGSKAAWTFEISTDQKNVTAAFAITTGPDSADAPDWGVIVIQKGVDVWSNMGNRKEYKFTVDKTLSAVLEVACPKGARYGDTIRVLITFTAGSETFTMEYNAKATASIMILKTQANQEKSVATTLRTKAMESPEKDIFALLSPVKLNGYIFVEGMNTDRMKEKTRGIRKARQFLDGETSIEEIQMYFTPVPTVTGITEGDIVELADGPFKGMKARVKSVDSDKENITVELIEGMMPIPVTVRGESVRRIDSDYKKE